MQHRLHAELAVALRHNRCAGIEIEIQVLVVPARHHKLSPGDLARGNLDAGLHLRTHQQRLRCVGQIAGQHHAIGVAATLVVGDAGAVGRENNTNLLIVARWNTRRTQRSQEALVGGAEQVNLRRILLQIGGQATQPLSLGEAFAFWCICTSVTVT